MVGSHVIKYADIRKNMTEETKRHILGFSISISIIIWGLVAILIASLYF